MKINRYAIRELQYILLIGVVGMFGLFYGLQVTQAKLGNWIYKEYTQPFLAQTPYIVQR